MGANDDYVRRWAQEHGCSLAPGALVSRFIAHIEGLPWGSPARIDYSGVPVIDLVLDVGVPDVTGTRLAEFDDVLAVFGPTDPGVIGPRDVVLTELDSLCWPFGGRHGYVCGVERDGEGVLIINATAFADYDGAERLVLVR